jgi:hypothetical protein
MKTAELAKKMEEWSKQTHSAFCYQADGQQLILNKLHLLFEAYLAHRCSITIYTWKTLFQENYKDEF